MNSNKQISYFLILCLAATFAIVYLMVRSFQTALILAAVFAFLFQPIYEMLKEKLKRWKGLAGFLTLLIAIVLVVIPTFFLGNLILREVRGMYSSINHRGGSGNSVEIIEGKLTGIQQSIPILKEYKINFREHLQKIGRDVLKWLISVFSGLAKSILDFLIFIFSFYFLLVDGPKLVRYLKEHSPFSAEENEFILDRTKSVVSSVVKGNLLIGLIQGVFSSVGFFLFGVPNAILLGTITGITGLVPTGTWLIILPAIIYLFIIGKTAGAVGLFLWSITTSIAVDYFISPRVIGKGLNLPQLAVFLSVIGGIAYFGAIGILLGPLFLSLFLVFMEMFKKKI